MFCTSGCCIGGHVARHALSTALDPALVEQVHIFASGAVELDYVTEPTDLLPGEEAPFGQGVIEVFKSAGSAIAWFEANRERLIPWAPRRAWIASFE